MHTNKHESGFIRVHSCAFVAIILGLLPSGLPAQQSALTLWYKKPAEIWTDALPVGNGRMGAMVFGRPALERIQFNEHTVWTGEPHDYAHRGASEHLQQIRELLWAGKQKEAEELAMKEFMSVPVRQKAYQSFGDLWLSFPDHTNASNYRRELDLDSAVARVRYECGGVAHTREVFASFPDQV